MKRTMKLFPILLIYMAALGCKQTPSGDANLSAPLAKPAKSKFATADLIIDEPASDKIQEWLYVAKESGHYQIGQAWIEVLSGGAVELSVIAGGKVIREDHVVRNTAVHRFECRIDELAAGETIQVSVKPSEGTKYRIGYMIAFATPTFPGAKVFNVADYGAVGDGKKTTWQPFMQP